MIPPLVLNDLSLLPATDRDQGRQRMAGLLQCIARLGRMGVETVVRINEPLDGIALAPDYLIGVWRGDQDVDLDLRRLYNSRIGVGPYLTPEELTSLKGDEDIEVRVNGLSSRGCEAAYLLDGVALSLASDPLWNTSELAVQITRMTVDGSMDDSSGIVRHISAQEHIDHHQQWIVAALSDVVDDDDLWARKEQLFPHLFFAPAIKHELRVEAKNADRFRCILKRLRELEIYFAGWDGTQFDADSVGSKCTPETPQTLKDNKAALTRLCHDEGNRLFSYHVRFTPGAGRLYFVPDAAALGAHIGFIRDKFIF